MFDHVGIVVNDLRRARDYTRKCSPPLGLKIVEKHRVAEESGWVVNSTGAPQSPFFVIGQGGPTFWPASARVSESPVHLSFRAPSKEAVNRFHELAIRYDAAENGAPGIRRQPFYFAFVIDLDGNNVEAGCYV